MATHGRDSLIAFDLYPTQEMAPRGKHDGSINGAVRDRSNMKRETNCPGWVTAGGEQHGANRATNDDDEQYCLAVAL
jgi:hypothetical protein